MTADDAANVAMDGNTAGETNGNRLKRKAEMQLMRTEQKLARKRSVEAISGDVSPTANLEPGFENALERFEDDAVFRTITPF